MHVKEWSKTSRAIFSFKVLCFKDGIWKWTTPRFKMSTLTGNVTLSQWGSSVDSSGALQLRAHAYNHNGSIISFFVKSKYVAQIISLTWFISTHCFIIWNWTKAVRKNEFWYKHILTVEISYQPFKFKKYFLGVLVAQSSVMSRKFREIYMLEFLFIRTKNPFPLFLGESFLSLYIRKQLVIKKKKSTSTEKNFFCVFSALYYTQNCARWLLLWWHRA